MKCFVVTLDYYNEGESGNDKYSYSSRLEAEDKFGEYRHAIEQEFCGCNDTDIIDEDDEFGMMDIATGSWAKVRISPK